MKTLRNFISAMVLCIAFASPSLLNAQGPPPDQQYAQGGAVTLQTFYDQLAPYGQWVNYPNYGYVFIPSVAPGFMPYSTSGHWVYNEQYGWTWASDYPWGWATFHYGRWNYDANYGWFWIPDLNWGPAWVAWRNCEGYYGWAPLPWGSNITVGFEGDYGIAAEHWCFVPQEHLCEINLGAFFAPRIHYRAFLDHSVIINRMDYDNGRRFGYFRGPDRVEVEGYVHHPVNVVAIDAYRRPNNMVVHNEEVRHDEHVQNVERHDEHQDMQRHDDHNNVQNVQHDNMNHGAPQRVVQINNVPQRGGNYQQQRGGDDHGNDHNHH